MRFGMFFLICAFIAGVLINRPCAAAPVFSDLSADKPYYAYAVFAVENGFLNSAETGSFNPDGFVSMFDAVKIFARVAGFAPQEADAASAADAPYRKNEALINVYARKYAKWDAEANPHIAFLLEKGVLKTDDLKNFVGTKGNGSEGVYALTNQEAARLLIKAAGLTAAQMAETRAAYSDDAKISAQNKPYVYYLKTNAVVFCGADNSFEPQAAVSRQNMARLLYLFGERFDINFETIKKTPQKQEANAAQAPLARDSSDGADSNAASPKDIFGADFIIGLVTEIFISADKAQITVANASSSYYYNIDPVKIDVYALRAGGFYKVYAESGQVSLIYEITQAKSRRLTGFVFSKRGDGFLLLNTDKKTIDYTEVLVTEKTVFTNAATGEKISFLNVPEKAKISAYLDEAQKTALYVTVL